MRGFGCKFVCEILAEGASILRFPSLEGQCNDGANKNNGMGVTFASAASKQAPQAPDLN
jgi:hypothetical protein